MTVRETKAEAKRCIEKYRDTITEKIEITKRRTQISVLERSPELLQLLASAISKDIEAGIPYFKKGKSDSNGNFRGCIQQGMFNPEKGTVGEYLKVREQKQQCFQLKSRGLSRIARTWTKSVLVDEIAGTIPEECDRTVATLVAKDHASHTYFDGQYTFERIDTVFEALGIDTAQTLRNFVDAYRNIVEAPGPIAVSVSTKKEALDGYLKDRERALTAVPDNYADMFPLARAIKRHFVLHIGPTNSGKTYGAISALEKSGEGVYLAPLRLLAVEQYERINADGLPCSLLTGEEEDIIEGATVLSATVEMADIERHIPCAVIDECQMVSDQERGGAWTTAILGIPADKVHLCAAPAAEKILVQMIEMCGDTYEIEQSDRKTPLIVEEGPFNFPKDVQRGDALIVFSRKNVHAVGADLQKKGYKVSIVYGALPPDVRNNQAEKFRNGETDVVVATDAIGMGMNLPIGRVVFLEQHKFDGRGKRMLKPSETKQIAGRAGRFGIYDTGYVNSFGEKKSIRRMIAEADTEIDTAMIDFPKALVGSSVKDAVKLWREVSMKDGFERSSTERIYNCAEFLERYSNDTETIYDLSTIPFDWRDDNTRSIWCKYALDVVDGKPLSFDISHDIRKNPEMQLLESWYKQADVMYAFADRYGTEEDKETVKRSKAELSEAMIRVLQETKLKPKTCSRCGKHLPWNHPYGQCEHCFQVRQNSYYGYGW